jgi:hypothetical protein
MNIDPAPTHGESRARSQGAAKQEFLWHVHEYINEYVRFGDAKAGFAGTIASGLLAVLYGSTAHSQVLQLPYRKWPAAAWLSVGAAIFLGTSILLALWTVRLRLRSSQTLGFIFWGSIAAHEDVGGFRSSFHAQSEKTLSDHLLHHIFDLSEKVCVPKYRNISLCIAALSIGGILAGAALVLQDPTPSTIPTAVRASNGNRPLDTVSSGRTTGGTAPP